MILHYLCIRQFILVVNFLSESDYVGGVDHFLEGPVTDVAYAFVSHLGPLRVWV